MKAAAVSNHLLITRWSMRKTLVICALLWVGAELMKAPAQKMPEPAGPHVVRGDTWSYQQVAKKYISRELKDPDSAKYGDTWLVVTGGPKGTRICGTVNAKNSFGGYAGESALYVTDYNGGVVAIMDDAAEKACDELIADAKTLP